VWFAPNIFDFDSAGIFYMLGVLCLALHLRQLVIRAGHPNLKWHMTLLFSVMLIDFVLFVGVPVVVVVIAVARYLGSGNAGMPNSFMESLPPTLGIFRAMSVAHGVTTLVLTYWLVVLLMWCSKAFRETI
jgi:hypothetical protein